MMGNAVAIDNFPVHAKASRTRWKVRVFLVRSMGKRTSPIFRPILAKLALSMSRLLRKSGQSFRDVQRCPKICGGDLGGDVGWRN